MANLNPNDVIRKRVPKVDPLYPPVDGREAAKGLVRRRYVGPPVMPYISVKDLNKPFPGEDPGGPSHLAVEIGIKGTF